MLDNQTKRNETSFGSNNNNNSESNAEDISFADDIKREENVLVLNKSNFDEAIANPFILVEFYAPWSGHCKALAPEYAKVATLLKEEGSNVLLAKVDASEETELAKKFEVRGYPTLKFYRNGKATEYSGGRTAEDLVKWLKKKTGPPALHLTTDEDVAKFKDSAEVVVIGFYADKESADAKTFLDVAADNDEHPFAIITCPNMYKSLGVEKDGIVLFKKFDEGRNDFEGELTAADLKKFVTSNSLPLVVDFNRHSKIFSEQIATVLLFTSRKAADYDTVVEDFKKVAKEFKGKVLFVTINTEENDSKELIELFEVKKDNTSSLRLIKLEGEVNSKFKPETSDINEQRIRSFVRSFLLGKLKSEVEDSFVRKIRQIFGQTFNSICHSVCALYLAIIALIILILTVCCFLYI